MSSDPKPGLDVEQLSASEASKAITSLSADEQSKLSKVLFPETHVKEVDILGKVRALRPLPVKHARALHSKLQPVAAKVSEAFGTKEPVDLNDALLTGLREAAVIIAEFHKWDDVLAAATADELSLTELQSVVAIQSQLNGENDFLLGPLRVALRIMQIQEIVHLKFQSMFTMQPSSKSGTAASTT